MTQTPVTVQDPKEPSAGPEIARELRALQARSRDFWSSFSTGEFFHPLGDAWSPADNVRHLLKSNRPVLRALGLPKLLLAVRFGGALRPSRTYAEVRERYFTRLSEGVTAGRFTPRPLEDAEQTEEQRRSLLADLDQVAEHLAKAITGWREWQLDRLVLPHPVLGRLTVREMLFFTLYHNLHHVRNVERRMPAARAGASGA